VGGTILFCRVHGEVRMTPAAAPRRPLGARPIRVFWPCDRVSERELRILRKIAWGERFDSPSIGDFRTTDRLTRRGLIAEFDSNHRGWHLTQRGRDLVERG
jgi:hypothetical protein